MAYGTSACKMLFTWFTISFKQKCSMTCRMQIRCSPGLCLGPCWKSSWCSPLFPSRLEVKWSLSIPQFFEAYSTSFLMPTMNRGDLFQGLKGIDAPGQTHTKQPVWHPDFQQLLVNDIYTYLSILPRISCEWQLRILAEQRSSNRKNEWCSRQHFHKCLVACFDEHSNVYVFSSFYSAHRYCNNCTK